MQAMVCRNITAFQARQTGLWQTRTVCGYGCVQAVIRWGRKRCIRQAGVNEEKLMEQMKVQNWNELTYDVYFPLLKLLQTAVKGKATVSENAGKN